jgi:WXXGXW repeat (2 copies)
MRIRFSLHWLLTTIAMLTVSVASFAQIEISVNFAPPELPVYEQPVCPGDGYIWTPGYWAWDGNDYFWVPGTWVLAPQPGYFWTPGYWAWGGNGYVFREGYWGPQVGFYGGINYGYGYVGHGYEGGRWDGDRFYYNRSVNNVNITEIHNVYNTTIVNDYRGPRVSYNGGNGGVEARPTPNEERVARARRLPPVAAQTQHVEAARSNPSLRVSQNHGKPPVAATPRPAAFNDRGVVQAQEGGRYTPAARQENTGGRPAVHPNDLPPVPRPTPANTGDPNRDRKYQQQQQKTYAKQDQERQRLQQQQDQEHQRMQQRQASDAERQQLEQRHQQQTQEMSQRHAQQQQQMQARQQPHGESHENGRPENGRQ